MTRRMLIDGAHPEEVRVVITEANKLLDYDVESSTKTQNKGNIYLAKVMRVEPSLQAAFVDYGGNRHGFLAFSEIHPDYYQIPIEDREALKQHAAEFERAATAAKEHLDEIDGDAGIDLDDDVDADSGLDADEDEDYGDTETEVSTEAGDAVEDQEFEETEVSDDTPEPEAEAGADAAPDGGDDAPTDNGETEDNDRTIAADAVIERVTSEEPVNAENDVTSDQDESDPQADAGTGDEPEKPAEAEEEADDATEPEAEALRSADEDDAAEVDGDDAEPVEDDSDANDANDADEADEEEQSAADQEVPESKGGRQGRDRRRRRSGSGGQPKRYKVQEVIKRNQIILVQVVKEERGNKGAALTTYLSLAGRYCVLMPNVTRGNGGVSRKITSATDRRRLRDLLKSLEVPDGMGVIMRTAGMERNKSEIKRDFDYLMRLWEDVRQKTLESSAPDLVYEEGDLVKRAIRDLYTREVEEIWVEGTDAYQSAKKLMRMMMPSHAKRVQPYKDESMPMFHRYQVENQIEAMHNPTVQLKSGGYLVINPTEALVAIDVNSGRATRERNIEETATKTNLEAASEIAHQLKLRDLAGLIVIDFIDMEERSNQRAVEKRFKDAVKTDRARIQVGRISNFGLLEMSRQRMRPSLVENSTQPCPHCDGTGYIRSTESMTLHALRLIEEEGTRMRSSEVSVTLPTRIALYLLNEKRDALEAMETKYGFRIRVLGDDSVNPTEIQIDRVKAKGGQNAADSGAQRVEQAGSEDGESTDAPRKKRSRRRRRKNQDQAEEAPESDQTENDQTADQDEAADATGENAEGSEKPSRRRRGRRGGRRRNQRGKGRQQASDAEETTEQSSATTDDSAERPAENTSAAPDGDNPDNGAEKQNDAENSAPPEPTPVAEATPDNAAGEANDETPAAEATAAAPAEPPKRGWWQRILD